MAVSFAGVFQIEADHAAELFAAIKAGIADAPVVSLRSRGGHGVVSAST
jgi:hypothetical protein